MERVELERREPDVNEVRRGDTVAVPNIGERGTAEANAVMKEHVGKGKEAAHEGGADDYCHEGEVVVRRTHKDEREGNGQRTDGKRDGGRDTHALCSLKVPNGVEQFVDDDTPSEEEQEEVGVDDGNEKSERQEDEETSEHEQELRRENRGHDRRERGSTGGEVRQVQSGDDTLACRKVEAVGAEHGGVGGDDDSEGIETIVFGTEDANDKGVEDEPDERAEDVSRREESEILKHARTVEPKEKTSYVSSYSH